MCRRIQARALAVWDSYTEDAGWPDRDCAFINAAGELPDGHPAHVVIRAHKAAVQDRLADIIAVDHPAAGDAKRIADQIFLLLEGGVTHRGIDGDDRLALRGRALTERLLTPVAD